jgi:hypothetical protein
LSFSCVKHPMTMAHHICGECGHQFCPECVVFPFGPSKAPRCIACALELGGVRRQPTGRPKLTRRSIKRRLAMQRPIKVTEAPPPPVDPDQRSEERWMQGHVRPDEVPGAWKQTYEG